MRTDDGFGAEGGRLAGEGGGAPGGDGGQGRQDKNILCSRLSFAAADNVAAAVYLLLCIRETFKKFNTMLNN